MVATSSSPALAAGTPARRYGSLCVFAAKRFLFHYLLCEEAPIYGIPLKGRGAGF